ncbi:MAG TPA: class I SAM-dependent methyltransferase [Candidatus Bathyarchaeia archaeon]|nr:class I SAM-dependent methyltransferase [Candidatus Bathyarchaeia archaeon]
MTCHGGFSLDEATRRSWYNPDAVLQDLGAGMVFVDVGCGDGFFSILAARKVGEKGRVYAVDSDALGIEKLNRKAQAEGLKNIVSKVAPAEETVFCSSCADVIFFSMVLHDFANPAKVLQNARKMIKPTGTLVDLDWKKQEMPFGPPVKIRFSQDHASSIIHDAGFRVDGVRDIGDFHYVLTAEPRI